MHIDQLMMLRDVSMGLVGRLQALLFELEAKYPGWLFEPNIEKTITKAVGRMPNLSDAKIRLSIPKPDLKARQDLIRPQSLVVQHTVELCHRAGAMYNWPDVFQNMGVCPNVFPMIVELFGAFSQIHLMMQYAQCKALSMSLGQCIARILTTDVLLLLDAGRKDEAIELEKRVSDHWDNLFSPKKAQPFCRLAESIANTTCTSLLRRIATIESDILVHAPFDLVNVGLHGKYVTLDDVRSPEDLLRSTGTMPAHAALMASRCRHSTTMCLLLACKSVSGQSTSEKLLSSTLGDMATVQIAPGCVVSLYDVLYDLDQRKLPFISGEKASAFLSRHLGVFLDQAVPRHAIRRRVLATLLHTYLFLFELSPALLQTRFFSFAVAISAARDEYLWYQSHRELLKPSRMKVRQQVPTAQLAYDPAASELLSLVHRCGSLLLESRTQYAAYLCHPYQEEKERYMAAIQSLSCHDSSVMVQCQGSATQFVETLGKPDAPISSVLWAQAQSNWCSLELLYSRKVQDNTAEQRTQLSGMAVCMADLGYALLPEYALGPVLTPVAAVQLDSVLADFGLLTTILPPQLTQFMAGYFGALSWLPRSMHWTHAHACPAYHKRTVAVQSSLFKHLRASVTSAVSAFVSMRELLSFQLSPPQQFLWLYHSTAAHDALAQPQRGWLLSVRRRGTAVTAVDLMMPGRESDVLATQTPALQQFLSHAQNAQHTLEYMLMASSRLGTLGLIANQFNLLTYFVRQLIRQVNMLVKAMLESPSAGGEVLMGLERVVDEYGVAMSDGKHADAYKAVTNVFAPSDMLRMLQHIGQLFGILQGQTRWDIESLFYGLVAENFCLAELSRRRWQSEPSGDGRKLPKGSRVPMAVYMSDRMLSAVGRVAEIMDSGSSGSTLLWSPTSGGLVQLAGNSEAGTLVSLVGWTEWCVLMRLGGPELLGALHYQLFKRLQEFLKVVLMSLLALSAHAQGLYDRLVVNGMRLADEVAQSRVGREELVQLRSGLRGCGVVFMYLEMSTRALAFAEEGDQDGTGGLLLTHGADSSMPSNLLLRAVHAMLYKSKLFTTDASSAMPHAGSCLPDQDAQSIRSMLDSFPEVLMMLMLTPSLWQASSWNVNAQAYVNNLHLMAPAILTLQTCLQCILTAKRPRTDRVWVSLDDVHTRLVQCLSLMSGLFLMGKSRVQEFNTHGSSAAYFVGLVSAEACKVVRRRRIQRWFSSSLVYLAHKHMQQNQPPNTQYI